MNLKQTLSDFRGSMEAEMNQLKKENKSLKEHISKCMCGCKQSSNNQLNFNNNNSTNNNTEKCSEDGNNSFGKANNFDHE